MKRVTLALLLGGCAVHGQKVAPHAMQRPVHHVPTEDGAHVALQHYANPGAPAVVLCHGISSNHHFWDLEPERSLAVYLHDAGYDVWNLDLRGHGLALRSPKGRRLKPDWNVDDYAQYDLPAALAYVDEATGDAPLHYVGHSLGGMILAAHLADEPEPALRSAVIVGSPLHFVATSGMTRFALRNARHLRWMRRLPTGFLAQGLALAGPAAPLKADELLFNPSNMEPAARRRMLRHVVSPMVHGELMQFGYSTDGGFHSADGSRTYADELERVRLPMLFFAGRADHIAPPDSVRAYYDAVGSEDKTLVIASRSNGMHGDYGHLDLGLGDDAAVDIFPRIRAFLDAHGSPP